MARHYEIFYCLETSIRQLIADRLKEEVGTDWWEKSLPEQIRKNAEDNRRRESETGMTPRSDEMIDFTTFGELGHIISANGKIFGDTFRDLRPYHGCCLRLTIFARRSPIVALWPRMRSAACR